MGFDNECIVNIQTLAGEYFCPVCRLLVYPNEALQSQCTHLYCKPCLTYVVGTTRACPYDGYLVTEPDSKPLLESNKALADIIGRIGVRCLYHRSGCQWQGPLSDCTTHCSGCAFGNSAVVCNRCAVQIVHRQVQEHAQTCPGVQPQVAQADGTQNLAATAASAPANSGQPQTATQTVAANSVAPIPVTGQDPNIQTGLNPQPQANGVSIGAVPTPEQLYQQQYYQQYPGYDPYQQAYQNYYPYPQQPQVYSQPQQVPQQPMQSQTPVQTQVPPQPQGQAQPQPIQNVNPQYQTPVQMIPQAQQQSQGYPYPYSQPQPSQTHPQPQQMLQFPQAQPQMQQNYPQMPPQPQPHPQAPQQSQQTQPQVQQQLTQALTGHHSYPQPQLMQMGTQQRPNIHAQSGPTPHLPPHQHGQYPPQSHPQVPLHQFPPQNQVPGALPAQQQPPNLYAQQPGHPPMQQMPHPQASSGIASGPVQNQLRPHGQLPPPPPSQPQLYQQPQNYSARPVMQNHEVQSQAVQQSLSGYPGQSQARPPYIGKNQQFSNENHQLRSGNQVQINESPSQRTDGKETNGKKNESVDSFKLRGNEDAKETGSELHSEENKPFETSVVEQKNDSDLFQKGENLTSSDKSKEGRAYTELQAHTSEENKSDQLHGQVHLSMQYPPTHQQRPTTLQPSFPPVPPHHPQVPGQPLNMLRPQGPGQPFNQHPDYVPQHGRPPSQFVPHERHFELQHSGDPRMPLGKTPGLLNPTGGFTGRPPFYGVEGQFGPQRPIGLAGNEFFQDPRPRYLDGQSPGQSQGRNLKEFMGTDERFNPSADRVSRTLEKEPFGLESGALAANRFLPPYEAGRGNFGHARPDFFRPVQGFGQNHFDRYASRSPGRENAGFPPRDFGDFPHNRPGMGNFEGQSRPFDGGRRPFGQFQRGELEGPGFQGPRSLPGHLRLGENFPPYRPLNSSYPPPGSLDPFDNPRKRLPPNNGWCRICKVDCEGVEGLEMHSQTREHQDMAMDMVRSIKLQNSKKQKMSNDRSLEELSKKRGPGYEVPGDKL